MTGEVPRNEIRNAETPITSTSAEELLKLLPSIPIHWLRLTHFTDKATADVIVGGEFVHDPGFLSSKTDAYTSVMQIEEVLTTGNTGAFNRSYFGDCAVLIDVQGREYKHRQTVRSTTSVIPNGNIVGYIQIIDGEGGKSYIFFPNTRYDPIVSAIKFSPLPISPTVLSDHASTAQTVGDQDEGDNTDVW